MTNDRAAFEAFWLTRSKVRPADFERFNDDTYVMDNVQRHWWTWQQCSAYVRDAMAAAAPAKPVGLLRGALAWINASSHGDNCFLHNDGGEYDRCFCGKDGIESALEEAIESAELASPAALAEPTAEARDAARYRFLRRGQHWSVLDGLGDDLWGYTLDYAIDAAMSPPQEPAPKGDA